MILSATCEGVRRDEGVVLSMSLILLRLIQILRKKPTFSFLFLLVIHYVSSRTGKTRLCIYV